jgi:hypothetical protein
MAAKSAAQMKGLAKRSNIAPGDAATALANSGRYRPRWNRSAKQGDRRLGRYSKNLTDLSPSLLERVFNLFRSNPTQAGRSADDAGDIVAGVKKAPGSAPNPTKGTNPEETARLRRERIEETLGDISNVKIFTVAGLTGMLIYAGIITDGTDGRSATITNINIDPVDNNFATVTYTNPSAAGYFIPAEGDTITLSPSTGLSNNNDYEIVDIPGDNMIKINISAVTPKRAKGSSITQSPGGAQMSFVCHSDFGNQFSGAVDDLVSSVFGTVATVTNIAVDEAGNVILNAADLAGSLVAEAVDAAADAADAATDAASDAFCKIVPFLCDTTIWLILGALIIGGIILTVVLNSKKQ